MKTIDNDIKTGQFKQIYLLYGEEQYLIRQYRDKLKHALAADDDTMNFSAFSGSDINQKEIIDLAETLPFFADRRLILIEDSGLFKKKCRRTCRLHVFHSGNHLFCLRGKRNRQEDKDVQAGEKKRKHRGISASE